MMKQQLYVMRLSPSKLGRLLLCLFGAKLCFLGLMLCAPLFPEQLAFFVFGGGQAVAAEAGAGAPPAPGAVGTLPDSGINRPSPGAQGTQGAPGAIPGVTAPEKKIETKAQDTRALPLLQGKTASAQGNATAPNTQETDIARQALAKKQEELARKETDLRTLETELAGKLEQMQLLENRLRIMINEAEEAKDAKFRHLVDVLSNMKSKQAAAVVETLDQKIAVRVLAGMRGRQAGEILTFVRPEIAAKLTEALARMQLPLE